VNLTHIEACVRKRKGDANAPVLREKEILEESTEFVSFTDLLAMVPGLEMRQAQRLAKNSSQFAEGVSSLNLEEDLEEAAAQAAPEGAEGVLPTGVPSAETAAPQEAASENPPGEQRTSGVATEAHPTGVHLDLPPAPLYPTPGVEAQARFDDGFKNIAERLDRLEKLLAAAAGAAAGDAAADGASSTAEAPQSRWLGSCADTKNFSGGEEVVLRTKHGKVVETG
jgi:hypothetical protein